MLKERYCIREIASQDAMSLVVENHYLHRKCPVSKAFGLFDKESGELKGCVTYGVPPSSTLLKGLCGQEEMHNVYELNRLWISDEVPRNGESWLVGNTLRLLDKEIIVSFADPSHNHVGYIYQASNFLYCGLSAKFRDPRVRGLEGRHHCSYAKHMSNEEVKRIYGEENVYFISRPRKHRYVFFNAKGKRRKELIAKLRYKILPYPKGSAPKPVEAGGAVSSVQMAASF